MKKKRKGEKVEKTEEKRDVRVANKMLVGHIVPKDDLG